MKEYFHIAFSAPWFLQEQLPVIKTLAMSMRLRVVRWTIHYAPTKSTEFIEKMLI